MFHKLLSRKIYIIRFDYKLMVFEKKKLAILQVFLIDTIAQK